MLTRTPNTLDAHRLIWLAQQLAVQDAVVERLSRAYFVEGMDLADRVTLVQLAVEGGVPSADADRLLAGDEGWADVLREEAQYKRRGVNSVPTFFLNGEAVFSGAVAPAMLAEAIREAMRVG